MAAPDYSGITSDIASGYNAQRQKAQQQEGANLQGQKDALARRAAQLGGGPSGALIKTEQQAGDQSAQRLQSANEGINQAQNQEMRGIKMTQLGQQYQTGEREAGQTFQAGENALNRKISEAGLTGTYNGVDTLAKTSATEAAKLGEAGLTGTFNGQDTLAKTTAKDQHDLAVGALTGSYNGQNTLASTGLQHTIDQDKLETDQNIRTDAFNAIQSLVAANYNGDDIKKIIQNAFPGFDINQLGDMSRITKNGPGQGGSPPPVAPRPVAGTAPASPPAAGGSYDPYAYHGESY